VKLVTKLVYAHDGESVYDELFLKALSERYDVYVLTFNPSPTHIPPETRTVKIKDLIPATNLHPFEGMRKHLLTPIRALIFGRLVSQVKPDILVGCWASTYGFYSALSRFRPFVLFIWGSDVLLLPTKYFPLKPLVVFSLKKADIVVVDSKVQEEAVTRLGCEPRKIVKFPWVNLSGLQRDKNQRKAIRKQYGWTDDNVVVVSLRNHRAIYGVGYLIDAIPNILERNKNVRFLILGEGPLTKVFKEKSRRFVDEGQVRFIGTVAHEKVAAYLSAADIYVSTSFSDGASASLLEAMACSLPAVTTDISGNTEWIDNETNGLLVPVADSGKLAEKILLLAGNEELRQRLRLKAEETVRVRVNWNANVQKLIEAIDKLVALKK